jgi:3-deoxy-D-arabino-heptulosonate 7-phosphate (DAHP) synthase
VVESVLAAASTNQSVATDNHEDETEFVVMGGCSVEDIDVIDGSADAFWIGLC